MIKLMKSTFYHEAETKAALVDFITNAPILSMADECKKFEEGFAKFQQTKYATFVDNGSVANLVLLQSLLNLGRLKHGDRIGFSAVTWATNVMPIIQLGLIPVAVDCELATLNVSLRTMLAAGEMRAMFITNVLGLCDDLPGIATYCHDKNIILLEDNCEALGSKVSGKLLGNYGLASTFSFFVGHHMSTIEGGMVCTNDEELADMLIMCRAHGWDRNLSPEKQRVLRDNHKIDDFFAKYTFYDLAYNARPTEINGFIGNTQLPYLSEIVDRRKSNFAQFQAAVKNQTKLYNLESNHMDIVSNFSMPIVFKTISDFSAGRKTFANAKIEIRPIIAGNIVTQPFYKKYTKETTACPNADIIHQQGLYFANNPELTEDEILTLVQVVESL